MSFRTCGIPAGPLARVLCQGSFSVGHGRGGGSAAGRVASRRGSVGDTDLDTRVFPGVGGEGAAQFEEYHREGFANPIPRRR